MKRRILAAVCVLAVLLTAAGVYLGAGYQAADSAQAAMQGSIEHGGTAAFVPEKEKEILGGLIFYPGGLVDYRAYAPLMQALKARGVLCLLTSMPLDLAVLDMNAADGLQALYPDVDRWLIGGHSLGGAMAASYLAKHSDEYEGLALLGAYSIADLSRADICVLSVYGTQDGVLNRSKYDECLANYPKDFTEVVIDGGCHAYFGDYGEQRGDGQSSISRQQQIEIAADAVAAMLR